VFPLRYNMPTSSSTIATPTEPSVAPPPPRQLKPQPSMAEFTAFHGMVCSPVSSQRCIEYFDGCALFASQEDYYYGPNIHHHLASHDYLRTPIALNLFSYYSLVVFSCTGFLSLLGRTKRSFICEENETFSIDDGSDDGERPAVQSKSLHNIPGAKSLVIPFKAIDYLIQRSQSFSSDNDTDSSARTEDSSRSGRRQPLPQVRLIRRFEFEFGNLLSVIMCHFVCSNGRKYLVEVYDFRHKESVITRTISSIFAAVRGLLGILQERTTASSTKQC
jgi:hypothetical protein